MIHAATDESGTVQLAISGMTCGGCVQAVTRVLSAVAGVTTARVDLAGARARVQGTASAEDLVSAVQAAGYGAALIARDGDAGGG
jgi:Cu+-exporting ATPase